MSGIWGVTDGSQIALVPGWRVHGQGTLETGDPPGSINPGQRRGTPNRGWCWGDRRGQSQGFEEMEEDHFHPTSWRTGSPGLGSALI